MLIKESPLGCTLEIEDLQELRDRLDFTTTVPDYGNANNNAELLAALESGKVVDLRGRTYRIQDTIKPAPGSVAGIINGKLVRVGGEQLGWQMLSFSNQPRGLLVDSCSFDLGGDFTHGSINLLGDYAPAEAIGCAGLKIVDCADIRVTNNRLFNGGPGNGIYTWGVSGVISENVIEDFTHDVDAEDDIIQAIVVGNCSNLEITRNHIRRLRGYIDDVLRIRHTRGITHGYSINLKITDNFIDTVGQPIDGTGGAEHVIVGQETGYPGGLQTRIIVSRNHISNAGAAGIKVSNIWRNYIITDNYLHRCALGGIYFARREEPAAQTFDAEPHNALVSGNFISDSGYDVDGSDYWGGGHITAGVYIDRPGGVFHHPQGILVSNNVITDEQMAVCTISHASPAVVGMVAHGKIAGEKFTFPGTTGVWPTGITLANSGDLDGSSIEYYVLASGLTADAFQFALTAGGTAINTSAPSVTAWLTATAYIIGDVRSNGGTNYYCIVSHTSGTFATDLAAGKWMASTHYCTKPTMQYGISASGISGSSIEVDKHHAFGNIIKGAKIADTLTVTNYVLGQNLNVAAGTIAALTVDTILVNNGLKFRRGVLNLVNGDNPDVVLDATASYFRILGPTGAFAITGFVANDGLFFLVRNATAQDWTIKNLTGSVGANQIDTQTGANVVLTGGSSAMFYYDGSLGKWVLAGTQG